MIFFFEIVSKLIAFGNKIVDIPYIFFISFRSLIETEVEKSEI